MTKVLPGFKMAGNILIIKLSAIGDVVHTLPFLEVLRANYPDSRIDWLIEKDACSLIQGHGCLDNIIVSDRKSWQKRLMTPDGIFNVLCESGRFIRELRQVDYDLVIDLQGLFKSGVFAMLSRGKRKVGLTGSREGARLFLTEKPFPVDYDQHAIERYLKTIDYLGGKREIWKGSIPLQDSDKEAIDNFLTANSIDVRRLIAITPMASWRTKLWEEEKFAVLAGRFINELGLEVVFTGSRGDRPVIDSIIGSINGKAYNLAGETSLKELAYLYSRCRSMITTDTGPMHIAAAMGCPVIALFGPTAPWRTGPYGEGHAVIRGDMECSPCFKKRCEHRSCMKIITVEKVFETLEGLLFEKTYNPRVKDL